MCVAVKSFSLFHVMCKIYQKREKKITLSTCRKVVKLGKERSNFYRSYLYILIVHKRIKTDQKSPQVRFHRRAIAIHMTKKVIKNQSLHPEKLKGSTSQLTKKMFYGTFSNKEKGLFQSLMKLASMQTSSSLVKARSTNGSGTQRNASKTMKCMMKE